MTARHYTKLDHFIGHLDSALRTALGPAPRAQRPSPAANIEDASLSELERRLAGRLLRVDHAGEVCAQALYQGQALTAKLPTVRQKMEQAAQEENDHLAWTEERIRQLGTHKSYLNPLWYSGSFAIGALAGLIGDKWSLGFVVETEKQVVKHLDGHLKQLSDEDQKSRAILEQMREDEVYHATTALNAGAAGFPKPVQTLMQFMSRVMTRTALWL
ncbi:MAG: 2-polyprenyl-3-methyl-6-methoxy-1,4-benzoquinone monooxygenase [Gammaproteobacteria bacterium]|nr:2-polyprenyl-3-methyl-6-methoxy-1,4-benzoquinone monooxygenase [Gammaproteobacteria bacterium]